MKHEIKLVYNTLTMKPGASLDQNQNNIIILIRCTRNHVNSKIKYELIDIQCMCTLKFDLFDKSQCIH